MLLPPLMVKILALNCVAYYYPQYTGLCKFRNIQFSHMHWSSTVYIFYICTVFIPLCLQVLQPRLFRCSVGKSRALQPTKLNQQKTASIICSRLLWICWETSNRYSFKVYKRILILETLNNFGIKLVKFLM